MLKTAKLKSIVTIGAMVALMPVFVFLFSLLPIKVLHAAGHVRFGSNSYAPNLNENFNVGVYAESTDEIPMGTFSITLTYDPNVIEYVGGASAGGNGTITINGASPDGATVRTMLTLRAKTKATTNLAVTGVTINDNTGVGMAVDGMPSAPITVQNGKTTPPASLSVNGKDIPAFSDTRFEYTVNIDYAEKLEVKAPAGYTVTTDATELKVGRNNVKVTLTQDDAQPIEYTLHLIMAEKKADAPADADKEQKENEKASEKPGQKSSEKESANIGNKTSEKESKSEEISLPPMPQPSENLADQELKQNRNYILVLVAFILGVVAIIGLKLLVDYIETRRGHVNDARKLNFKVKMVKDEKEEEAANPFDYASIDEYNGRKPIKKGQEPKLIFDTPARGVGMGENGAQTKKANKNANAGSGAEEVSAEAAGAAEMAAGASANAGGSVPKLDFSKRVSAAAIARNGGLEAKAKEAEKAEQPVEEMDSDEINDFIENVTSEEEDDVEFIDIEKEVSDRKPKKKS